MACAENQNFATRRLLKDFKQIQNNKIPTVNISCVPLEDDLFVWHGNLVGPAGTDYEGAFFHFELSFPETYPIDPPTILLFSQIKHPNVFDGMVCLDMFNSTQDKNGSGWSPAYSIESILIQLQAFLFQSVEKPATEKEKRKLEHELEKIRKKANDFECEKCSHRTKVNPYPPIRESNQVQLQEFSPKIPEVELFEESLVCYHSKLTFKECPLGLGLNIERVARTGNMHYCNPTPDLISLKAFNKQGVRKSSRGEKFGFWIPLYLSPDQKDQTLHLAKHSLSFIKSNNSRRFTTDLVEELLLKIMSSIVIKTADLKNHASCAVIQLLVFAHGLTLLFAREYPEIVDIINGKLKDFIEQEDNRVKDKVPYLIYILMYLFVSDTYSFDQVIEKYSEEQLDRQIFWILQKIPELNKSDSFIIEDSLEEVAFKSQSVSYSIVMVCKHYYTEMRKQFGTWMQCLEYLEVHRCKLPNELEDLLQKKFKHCIEQVDSFEAYYEQVGLPRKSREELTAAIKTSRANSLRKKYHGSEEEINKVPNHVEQVKQLPFRKVTLKNYIVDKKVQESTEEVWKERCRERWGFVNRYLHMDVRTTISPALIAECIDNHTNTFDKVQTNFKDLKEFYDDIFRGGERKHRKETLENYGPSFSWKELYFKLDVEEEIIFLNDSEELSSLYNLLEAVSQDLTVLTLRIIDVERLKSKYHYLTKTISLLPCLKSLTITSHTPSTSLVTSKVLISLVKGFTKFRENNSQLTNLTIEGILLKNEDNDTTQNAVRLFELWNDIKCVSFQNTNILNVKKGDLICNYLIQNTNLVQVHFINSIKTDRVGGCIADGMMRNKKISKLLLSRITEAPLSFDSIIYNLAFNPSLKHIQVNRCTIGSIVSFIDKLQKLVSINSTIEELVLTNIIDLPKNLGIELYRAFGANQTLKLLDISQEDTSSEIAHPTQFGHSVAANAHKKGVLTHLYLDGCLGKQSLNDFVEGLHYTKNLIDSWYGSGLASASQSTIELKDIEKHYLCKIEVLSIGKTQFGNDFSVSFWKKLKNNYLLRKNSVMPGWLRIFTFASSLESLSVVKSNFSWNCLDAILFVMENGFFNGKETVMPLESLRLKHLELSHNPISKLGAKTLSSLSKFLPDLKILDLNHCKLGVSGATSIAKSAIFTNLTSLNIFCNRIDVDGARAISAALKTNTNLQILDIGYNRIKDEGLKQIGEGLKSNPQSNLKYLNLRFNLFTFTSFEPFLASISASKLQVLMIKRNEIEDFYLNEISSLMKKIPQLTYIDQVQKLEMFNDDRTSRSIWIPQYSDSQKPNLISAIKKLDSEITVLSVSERKGKNYPNKPKNHSFGYIEFAHPIPAGKVMKALMKDRKRRGNLMVILGKAKLAGTGRFYYNKRTLEKLSKTNKFKSRVPRIESLARAARSQPFNAVPSLTPGINQVDMNRMVVDLRGRGGLRGRGRFTGRGGDSQRRQFRDRSPYRRRSRSRSSDFSESPESRIGH